MRGRCGHMCRVHWAGSATRHEPATVNCLLLPPSSDAFDFKYGICLMRMKDGLNVSRVMQAHGKQFWAARDAQRCAGVVGCANQHCVARRRSQSWWGHHSRAGTEGDGDSRALPCCLCSSSPSPVNPTFEAAEHSKENGASSRAALGTGWLGWGLPGESPAPKIIFGG